MPEPRRQMAFRPTDELRERIERAAGAFGVNANFFMERLLSEALDDLIDPSEFRLTQRPTTVDPERPLMCGVDGCLDGGATFFSVEEVVAHEQTCEGSGRVQSGGPSDG